MNKYDIYLINDEIKNIINKEIMDFPIINN